MSDGPSRTPTDTSDVAWPAPHGGSPIAASFAETIEIVPIVVLSQTFNARPSSIPDIGSFVQRSLMDSPLSPEGNREVQDAVYQALLEAASPTGTIQVSFRIFTDHVEVDVLRSQPEGEVALPMPSAAPLRETDVADDEQGSFSAWMVSVLERRGLTKEDAAAHLGVSVKTVGRWLGGETEPRYRDLRRIQEVFGDHPLG